MSEIQFLRQILFGLLAVILGLGVLFARLVHNRHKSEKQFKKLHNKRRLDQETKDLVMFELTIIVLEKHGRSPVHGVAHAKQIRDSLRGLLAQISLDQDETDFDRALDEFQDMLNTGYRELLRE